MQETDITSAFHILQLPVSYALAHELIQAQYHKAVIMWHPDRTPTMIEKSIATQRSRQLNEAYQRLTHPLFRAEEVMRANKWEAIPAGADFLMWILDQDLASFQHKWEDLKESFSQAVQQNNQEQACILYGQMVYVWPRLIS